MTLALLLYAIGFAATATSPLEDGRLLDKPVWRDEPPLLTNGAAKVSVDYGGDTVICTVVSQAGWESVKRWRWGWP